MQQKKQQKQGFFKFIEFFTKIGDFCKKCFYFVNNLSKIYIASRHLSKIRQVPTVFCNLRRLNFVKN